MIMRHRFLFFASVLSAHRSESSGDHTKILIPPPQEEYGTAHNTNSTSTIDNLDTNINNNETMSSSLSPQPPQRLRGRRLERRPYYYWYSDKNESLETKNGVLPTLSCPLGTYREFGNPHLGIAGGLRLDGCIDCPAGRYGDSTDLRSSQCTGPCPRGTYLDEPGGKSIDDCKLCPVGTYGDEVGLTTKACSGSCTDFNTEDTKYYSGTKGLTTRRDCKVCPEGYRGWQCQWALFVPTEKDHHYENGFADVGN